MLSSEGKYPGCSSAVMAKVNHVDLRMRSIYAADFSVFVGDLAPDVTDYALQENFRHFLPQSGVPRYQFSHTQIAKHTGNSNVRIW